MPRQYGTRSCRSSTRPGKFQRGVEAALATQGIQFDRIYRAKLRDKAAKAQKATKPEVDEILDSLGGLSKNYTEVTRWGLEHPGWHEAETIREATGVSNATFRRITAELRKRRLLRMHTEMTHSGKLSTYSFRTLDVDLPCAQLEIFHALTTTPQNERMPRSESGRMAPALTSDDDALSGVQVGRIKESPLRSNTYTPTSDQEEEDSEPSSTGRGVTPKARSGATSWDRKFTDPKWIERYPVLADYRERMDATSWTVRPSQQAEIAHALIGLSQNQDDAGFLDHLFRAGTQCPYLAITVVTYAKTWEANSRARRRATTDEERALAMHCDPGTYRTQPTSRAKKVEKTPQIAQEALVGPAQSADLTKLRAPLYGDQSHQETASAQKLVKLTRDREMLLRQVAVNEELFALDADPKVNVSRSRLAMARAGHEALVERVVQVERELIDLQVLEAC